MSITSIHFNPTTSNANVPTLSPTDTEAKNIQNQITHKNQSLNRLSSDSEMSAEEKAKERQELQKQIAELNRKLRMLRMEKKEEVKEVKKEQEQEAALNEKQEEEATQNILNKDTSPKELKEQQEKSNITPKDIQKMLEADSFLQKERIQQNINHKKELTENILETEINSDKLYGTDTTAKEEILSSLIEEKPLELKMKETQETQTISSKNKSMKIIIREEDI